MRHRLALVVIRLLILLIAAAARPAHATGGGSTLPFNDTLTLIQDNLTGPTANTIVVILIVCGLIAIGVSRETPWLRTLGGLVVICALIAKAATLPSALGLGSATATVGAYCLPAWLLSAGWFVAVAAPLLPLLKPHRRSAEPRA